ncbi:hypothetical protein OESDEN_18475 [Oesophagostomum dentatum]|uniref:Uncharacterized protein n=1 Tax=Oesophagostomum dentatum TaxID=61180 RepID=A0A0B1SD57_OESDE|nr:hypothetical protein OESDEN_18475 [Oesophagostomum dentatum]
MWAMRRTANELNSLQLVPQARKLHSLGLTILMSMLMPAATTITFSQPTIEVQDRVKSTSPSILGNLENLLYQGVTSRPCPTLMLLLESQE